MMRQKKKMLSGFEIFKVFVSDHLKCNKSQNNCHTPTVWLFMLLFRLWVNGSTMFYATFREKSNKEINMKVHIHLPVSYSIKRIMCLPYVFYICPSDYCLHNQF